MIGKSQKAESFEVLMDPAQRLEHSVSTPCVLVLHPYAYPAIVPGIGFLNFEKCLLMRSIKMG